ncbi:TPA: hypothetical protein ACUB6H_001467 [Enterobacter cloacae]
MMSEDFSNSGDQYAPLPWYVSAPWTNCFGIPQLWLGYKVSAALGLPEESVFIWVVLIALLFLGINGMTMFLISKGLMRAVQVHLTLAVISLVFNRAWRKLLHQARRT